VNNTVRDKYLDHHSVVLWWFKYVSLS